MIRISDIQNSRESTRVHGVGIDGVHLEVSKYTLDGSSRGSVHSFFVSRKHLAYHYGYYRCGKIHRRYRHRLCTYNHYFKTLRSIISNFNIRTFVYQKCLYFCM